MGPGSSHEHCHKYLSSRDFDGVFLNLCFFSDDVKNKLNLNNKKSYIA